MPGQGHRSYLAVQKESTWGTKIVSSMDFIEFLSESLKFQRPNKVQAGINGGRTQTKRKQGVITAGGEASFEVNPEDFIGDVLKGLLLGEAVTPVTGGGSHVFTIADADPFSYTVQKGVGGVAVMDWFGGVFGSLKLDGEADAYLKATIAASFKDQDGGTPQVPVFSTERAFIHHECTFTIDAVSTHVTQMSLALDAGIKAERRSLVTATILQQRSGMFKVGGNFTAYFDDLTLYNKFKSGASASIVWEFTGSLLPGPGPARSLKIEVPKAYFDGETAATGGADEDIMQPVPFIGINEGGAGEPVRITLVNTRATAY